jgi:hypothetical protein
MFGSFRAISLPHVTHSENGYRGAYKARVFCHWNHFFVFRNEHAQSTTFHPKLMLGAFVQFRCRTSPIPKTGIGCIQTQFLQPEPFLRCSQRTCPIHNISSKTHVGCFLAISLPHVTHSENGYQGAYKARVFATGTISSFFATNMLSPKLMFRVVSRNFVAARHPFRKRVSGCIQSTSFCNRNHLFVFRNEHAQSNRSKTLVWGAFA